MKNKSAQPNRLKELRDRSRLTLEEVGLITGFNTTTISRHESGARSLSEEAILKYASLYKVHTYEIFRLTNGVEHEDED